MSDEVVVRVADAELIRGQDGFSPIFSSEAIPGGHLVRVEDVNGPHEFNVLDGERGKTGATGAKGDKGDPGNYTKPDSGIPKNDLASDVQTSLGKADTALQSVPSTYRPAAEQDVIDGGLNSAITALQNAQQFHKGDTFKIANGLMLMATASSAGTAGGATINLPKEIGSDVTNFTWTGTINFWAEKDHPNGITGLTITGIVKISDCNLGLNFAFPSGTSLGPRTMGFLNMNPLTITFN